MGLLAQVGSAEDVLVPGEAAKHALALPVVLLEETVLPGLDLDVGEEVESEGGVFGYFFGGEHEEAGLEVEESAVGETVVLEVVKLAPNADVVAFLGPLPILFAVGLFLKAESVFIVPPRLGHFEIPFRTDAPMNLVPHLFL